MFGKIKKMAEEGLKNIDKDKILNSIGSITKKDNEEEINFYENSSIEEIINKFKSYLEKDRKIDKYWEFKSDGFIEMVLDLSLQLKKNEEIETIDTNLILSYIEIESIYELYFELKNNEKYDLNKLEIYLSSLRINLETNEGIFNEQIKEHNLITKTWSEILNKIIIEEEIKLKKIEEEIELKKIEEENKLKNIEENINNESNKPKKDNKFQSVFNDIKNNAENIVSQVSDNKSIKNIKEVAEGKMKQLKGNDEININRILKILNNEKIEVEKIKYNNTSLTFTLFLNISKLEDEKLEIKEGEEEYIIKLIEQINNINEFSKSRIVDGMLIEEIEIELFKINPIINYIYKKY